MSSKVKVAVLDNGIKKNILQDTCVTDIFISSDGTYKNVNNDMKLQIFQHGTNCALIIRKLCKDCQIGSVRVTNDEGKALIEKLRPAFEWCYQNDFRLVNLSLGTTHFQDRTAIRDIVNHYANKGMIIVAASANSTDKTYPASFSNVIGVSAGDKFEVDDDLLNQKGIDFAAPSGHEIMMGGSTVKLPNSNSYAAPYVTALIANLLIQEPYNDLCQVRMRIMPEEYRANFIFNPDWIETAWVSNRCNRSRAEYYFKEMKEDLETCISKVDTIVIRDTEELEKYQKKNKHIVYLGKEVVERPSISRYFWSREQRISQIAESKKREADIDIPFIFCRLDDNQDAILFLTGLKDRFAQDGYNIYALSNMEESVLYDLEFLPEELCNQRQREQVYNFLYWQTFYGRSDAILLATNIKGNDDLDTLETVADMIICIENLERTISIKVYCDDKLEMEEIFDILDHETMEILYQMILRLFAEGIDEQ